MRLLTFIAVAFSACSASAQTIYVTTSAAQYRASTIVGASTATATGTLINGGLGDVPSATWAGRVVFMQRGAITYLAKVRNAESMGAVAVIVANTSSSADTGTLGTGNTSPLPAVVVSKADGASIATQYGTEVRVGTAVVPPPTGPKIPDPVGHAGEFLYSDGTKYLLSANSKPNPTVSISLEVAAGKQAAFTAAAWGPTPYTFQWSKDGVNIPGATAAALVFPAAKLSDAGQYVCLVSNAYGATATRVATLTVK